MLTDNERAILNDLLPGPGKTRAFRMKHVGSREVISSLQDRQLIAESFSQYWLTLEGLRELGQGVAAATLVDAQAVVDWLAKSYREDTERKITSVDISQALHLDRKHASNLLGRAPISGEIAQRNLIGEEFILSFSVASFSSLRFFCRHAAASI